jgi:predicted ATPase
VLDGCEHVVEPISWLTSRLLAAAPGLRVLATSQEPLGLADEITLPVSPLAVPAADATAAELANTGAVRLFVKRAAAAAPGFALTDGNAAAVATICRRLDGIPLALELAATRVRALDVVDLAKRLDDRFRLLSSGSRTAPARQRTLRAVLDWSWELLPAAERAVLRRLAVHADGCTLTAAEQTAAGGEVAAEEVLDLLARLVDRSLVTVRDGDGERRYRLLESVAAYCLERLAEAGETASARQRHADYYLQLAESSEPKLRGHEQHQALRLLDSESGNLRAAMQHTAAQGLAAPALRLVNSLAWYWFLRGRLPTARHALTTALAVDPGGDPVPAATLARARAWLAGLGFLDYHEADPTVSRRAVLAHYGELADDPSGEAYAKWLFAFTMIGSGDVTVAGPLVTEALAVFRQLGDRWGIAAALTVRADLELAHGDLAAVERDSEHSRTLFADLGDKWGTLYPTDLLGRLAAVRGDYDRAARLHREALRVAEHLQLWPVVSRQLASMGRLCLLTGDLVQATEYHERALRIAEEQSHGSAAAFAGTGLAMGDRQLGRLDRAEARQRELLDWSRRVNYLPGCALAMAELGFIAELRHDAEAAGRWHAEGLAAARETGDPRAVALALEGLAGVSVLIGLPDRAARLLGAAAAARESAGASLPTGERGDVDRICQGARAAIGESEFALHLGQGGKLALADAVALAAETVDGKPGISGS